MKTEQTSSDTQPQIQKPERQMRRITSYQALWRPIESKGHFWFTYYDGERQRTEDLEAESFRIILEILETNKPIFADHTTSAVAVHWPDCDINTGAWA